MTDPVQSWAVEVPVRPVEVPFHFYHYLLHNCTSYTSSLIFHLTNYFFICGTKIWAIFWVITIIKQLLIRPEVLISVTSLYFITKAVGISKQQLSPIIVFLSNVIIVKVIHWYV